MNIIIEKVYEIVSSLQDNLISKVRFSPDNKSIIVDINYNKTLRIDVINNTVYIHGDKIAANKLKKLIDERIHNNANNL